MLRSRVLSEAVHEGTTPANQLSTGDKLTESGSAGLPDLDPGAVVINVSTQILFHPEPNIGANSMANPTDDNSITLTLPQMGRLAN